jgi:mono/diheme cytochrome c family protein
VRGAARTVFALVLLALVAAFAWGARLVKRGFSAREEPSAAEARLARELRHLSIPESARAAKNPVPESPAVLKEARAHFADHCAQCHGNDGKGQTEMGKNLYPKAPDMTLGATQSLSDGEIFSIIKNGVRLSGMPAWGEDTPEDDTASWKLVRLVRHFPSITKEEVDEMESLNPVAPDEDEGDEHGHGH